MGDADLFISVTEAFDEGGPIGLNDDYDALSVFTKGYNKIQVPETDEGAYVSLIYKAGPDEVEFIDDGSGVAAEASIPLPMALTEALLAYIGYRAHMSPDGEATGKSDKFYAMYTAACNFAEKEGLIPTDSYNRPNEVKGFEI